jgi:hypothetical protein
MPKFYNQKSRKANHNFFYYKCESISIICFVCMHIDKINDSVYVFLLILQKSITYECTTVRICYCRR